MTRTTRVINFGQNIDFNPANYYEPKSESELLDILNHHHGDQIRVVASKHAWSNAIVTTHVLISMRHFQGVKVDRSSGEPSATVGGGTQIKTILAELQKEELTTPSVGLITEQTIAGAISTGTHGSGKYSMSHYIDRMRIACYSADGKTAEIREVASGLEIEAARCGLGCLGVIISVTFRCIPQYWVTEKATPCDSIDEALSLEERSPLQQFFLLPHLWKYIVQERSVSAESKSSSSAWLYRIYWFLSLDIGLHLGVIGFARYLKSRRLVRFLFRTILPNTTFPKWIVTDRSDKMLVMEHELFRHLEIELFVGQSKVVLAADFVTQVLQFANGDREAVDAVWQTRLEEFGMSADLQTLFGTYCHHYPICFRRILADDTLISMSAGEEPWWYSISFITYVQPREPFFKLGAFLARNMAKLFGARPHWGKWFPLGGDEVALLYPRLPDFRDQCVKFDPNGVFLNQYVRTVCQMRSNESEGRSVGQ